MIFMGPLFQKKQEQRLLSQAPGGISNAANSFQWNLIDGLRAQPGTELTVINALPVGTWPRHFRKLRLPDRQWQLSGRPCFELGCFNLPVFKQLGRYFRARRLLRPMRGQQVLLCTAYMPFLWAAQGLHRSNTLTVLVTDLPEYADMRRVSPLHKLLRRANTRLVYRFLGRADRFVVVTEAMAQALKAGSRPYLVLEGICPQLPEAAGLLRQKAILYTGRLNARYGVMQLLEAFRQLPDPQARLLICGRGEQEMQVRQAAAEDARIQYLGFLPHEEVLLLQQQVMLLVNPRPAGEAYTHFSFPSKTLEYLASGTPVLMHRLPGIPAEYDPYLNYIPGSTAADLCRAMESLLRQPPLEKARLARKFVLEEKSGPAQAQRLLEFLR